MQLKFIISRIIFQIFILPLKIWLYLHKKIFSIGGPYYIEIDLKGSLEETPPTSGITSMVKPPARKYYTTILDIIHLDRLLTADKKQKWKKKIKGILVTIKNPKISWGRAWELRDILENLNKKIPVHVYSESGNVLSYYISLGGVKIYMPPSLHLDLIGFETQGMFYKELFNKLKVQPNFLRIGSYKSAGEKYTRSSYSPNARMQLKELLTNLQNEFGSELYQSRKKIFPKNKKFELNKLQEKAPYTTQEAFKIGLIDGVLYKDQCKEILKQQGQSSSYKFLKLEKALKKIRYKNEKLFHLKKKKKIAFVVGEGVILDSKEENSKGISYNDYSKALKKVKKGDYEAVVFRWNSPGGSANASDKLWGEIIDLQKDKEESIQQQIQKDSWLGISEKLTTAKKPKKKKKESRKKKIHVLVSHSDVAASGGYYLSAISKDVFSTPLSITGSIGVIAGKFNVQNMLKRFGITLESIHLGNNSDLYSAFSNFTPKQKKRLHENMNSMYDLFLDRIQKGRNISIPKLRKLGGGRVYSGRKAHSLGLVDHIGGLRLVFDKLASKLDLKKEDNLKIDIFPKIKPSLMQASPELPASLNKFLDLSELGKENILYMDEHFFDQNLY